MYRTLIRGGLLVIFTLLAPSAMRAQVVLNEICADNAGAVISPGGTSPDYVELYNTNAASVSLTGWSLTDDAALPSKFPFPTGTSIPGHGFLMVWLDTRTNYAGLATTNFSLKSSGEEVGLYQGGILKDRVKFGPQVADVPLSRIPNGTGPWNPSQPSPLATNKALASGGIGTNIALRINEWLATNSAGPTSDWLELYNPSTNGVVALGGLVLSDIIFGAGTNVTTPAIIPNSFIGSGGFLRFWCDGTTNGGNHLQFKISHSLGETLTLYQPNRTTLIDRVSFGPQTMDTSMGRLPDGGTNFFYFSGATEMSPGSPNVWQPLTNILINEVLAHTDPPLEDAIELYNPNTVAVDISHWYVSNNEEFPLKFHIPANTVLLPGGYRAFYEQSQANGASTNAGFNRSSTGNAPDFTFNSAHGDLAVLTEGLPDGGVTGRRTSRGFGSSANGVSFGRYVKSDGGTDLVSMSARTLGADNPATVAAFRSGNGLPNAYPLVGPIIITEIMYHPSDTVLGGVTNNNTVDEFIELQSLTNAPLPLYDPAFPTNTWQVVGGITFKFPTNQIAPPEGHLLLVNFDPATNTIQLAAFRATYGVPAATPIYGPYSGSLGNLVDTVQLEKPDPVQTPPHPDAGYVPYVTVEKIKYENTNGWPENAGGTGFSIHRLSRTGYANDQTNWFGAAPTPGTSDASGTPPIITAEPQSLVIAQGDAATFSLIASGTAPLAYRWRANGTNAPNGTNPTLLLNSVATTQAGLYDCVVSNNFGAVTSSLVTLTVGLPPAITSQPANQTVAANSSATFSLIASGTAPLAYRWRANGTNAPNGTNPTLLLNSVATTQAGLYDCVVSNNFGAVTSSLVTLTVGLPPAITRQPADQYVPQNANITLSVVATGTATLAYQWQRNSTNLPGAIQSVYSVTNVQTNQAGSYSVTITNLFGSVTSTPVTLSVAGPPSLRFRQRTLNGTAEMELEGLVGHAYEIEASTDPAPASPWTLIHRLTNSLGTEPISDPGATNLDLRFYRGKVVSRP